MIERERKYRITDEEEARLTSILSTTATLIVREVQTNVIYRDRATRLRKGTYVRLRTAGVRRELTFKGKKTLKGLDRSRLELNVALGAGPLPELLAALGLKPDHTYVKETEIWRLGGVHVSLDRVEDLGRFCELEAVDEDADLQAVADTLGLSRESWEPRGYRTLTADVPPQRSPG